MERRIDPLCTQQEPVRSFEGRKDPEIGSLEFPNVRAKLGFQARIRKMDETIIRSR